MGHLCTWMTIRTPLFVLYCIVLCCVVLCCVVLCCVVLCCVVLCCVVLCCVVLCCVVLCCVVLCCVVLCTVAIAASVRVVQDWFAQCHLQQFAKAKEHLKRRCGMVTPRVKGEMERLL